MKLRQLFKAMFTSVPTLKPADGGERVRSGAALLIDVREPHEWADGVAAQAVLLPLSDLNGSRQQWRPLLEQVGNRDLILYCKVGGRATLAAKVLAAEGFRAANGGGFSDWTAAGWPTVKPGAR